MIVLLQVVISKTSCPIKFCLLPEKQPRLRSKEIKVNVNNYFESLSLFLLPFRENALTAQSMWCHAGNLVLKKLIIVPDIFLVS